jgi:hydrogenase expression/formation protein HypE
MTGQILLAHGSGGKLSHELVERGFLKVFSNPILDKLDDSAVVDFKGKLAFTTDSFVVNPIFFPGGDIGKLAICGTVNDLSMVGAEPLYISLSFIIEEGFHQDDLDKIVESIKKATTESDVKIVTGDTKVVTKGGLDKFFINTAGIGKIPRGVNVSASNIKAGDKIILSGSIGDHGIAVLSQREGLKFSTALKSDCAPLNKLVDRMLHASHAIHAMRDPTRGGLATILNELAQQSKTSILIDESALRVKDEVRGACEMLGLDPIYIANEGKLVAFVASDAAAQVMAAMKQNVYGRDATVIGTVTTGNPGRVVMKTKLGTTRIIDMLVGEALPRIC